MVDLCAPYNLTLQIIFAVRYVNAHYKEKSAFWKALPELLERLRYRGDLELLPSSDPNAADKGPSSWVVTNQGLHMTTTVYNDISLAIRWFNVSPETQAAIGLWTKVVVRATKTGSPRDLRKRIGTHWPQQVRDRILQDKSLNPFMTMPDFKRIGRFRLATGLVRKATRSRFVDLFMSRLLALAQLCGVGEVNFKDLAELAVHGSYYEKLARAYVAMMIGNVDKTAIANLSFGPIVNKGPLGSTANVPRGFAEAVPKMTGNFVQLGVVQNGTISTTWPSPTTQIKEVGFSMDKKAEAKEGEPIYMIAGWAACLALRSPDPPPDTRVNAEGLWVVQRDIHGSPMYLRTGGFKVSIKRVADGRLVAKPAAFGIYATPNVIGQGVYGKACDCRAPDANRRLDVSLQTMFNGVVVNNFDFRETGDFTFHNLYVLWSALDMVMIVDRADRHQGSTYVQVYGECLYCAVDRALGTGCSFIVAGGSRRHAK